MIARDFNVSAPPGDKPIVVMATNVNYELPNPLASGYAFSVFADESDNDSGASSAE